MTAMPMPLTPRRPILGGAMPVARFGVVVNLAVPGGLLAWDAWHGRLGADPAHFALTTTGLIAVTYLLLSLVVTPVATATRQPWVGQFRRAIGCWAFYFAAAHLFIYYWWDRGRDLHATAFEILHRTYLLIGFVSLALMVPLWATSFDAAVRFMGGGRWKWLHRLAYVAAGLAVTHYWMQSKADKRQADAYIAGLAGLLLWRYAGGFFLGRRPAILAATVVPAAGKASHWRGDLRVTGTFAETPTVRTFRLAMPDGSPVPFAFRAGQFLSLSVPIDGRNVSRSYTIASSPTRDAHVELTVKREPRGGVSAYLHDMLVAGHTVTVAAPAGRFTFDGHGERGVTLVAGGVGITPCMSILRDLTDRSWPGQIDLLFVVRAAAEIVFADELDLLARRHANLRVRVWLTGDAPPGWPGGRGRLTADAIRAAVPDVAARPALVCGPDAMAAAARADLIAAGVPAGRVTVESFTPAAAGPAVPVEGPTATVTFARSGVTASLSPGTTVLDAAESVGVAIDYQCRAGLCGTCRCKLLAGRVDMAVRDALTDADEDEGYILACQATAAGDVTVDA